MRSAGDDDVETGDDCGLEERRRGRRQRASNDEVGDRAGPDHETADVHGPVLASDVRDDHVQPTAIGEHRIDEWRSLLYTLQADGIHDVSRPGRARSARERATLEPVLVATYIRVSTARDEMVSPDIQRRAITEFIRSKELEQGRPWRVVKTEDDLDQSGRTFNRAGIRGLIKGVKDGKWSAIVVYNYSRFGRNTAQALLAIGEVEAANGQLLSATEPFDTSNGVGKFSRGTLLQIAQLQSDQISEGWKGAQALRLDRGLPSGGNSRWGYRYHNPKRNRQCRLGCEPSACETGYALDRDLGPVLAECYRMFLRDKGLLWITNWLNEQGHPTSRGASWSVSTVSRMLDSGWGAGLVLHKDPHHQGEQLYLKGAHEPVITPSEWAQYLAKRDRRAATPPRARSAKWSLVGIAKCGLCGGGLNSVRNKPLESSGLKSAQLVRCIRRSGQGKSMCPGVWINEQVVDEAAFAVVKAWADYIERAAAEIASTRPARLSPKNPLDVERRRLTSTITQADRKLHRLRELFVGSTMMTIGEYETARAEQESRVAEARERLAELLSAEVERPKRRDVQRLVDNWPTIDPAVKNRILRSLLDKVIVYPRFVRANDGTVLRDAEGGRMKHPSPRIVVVPKPGIPLPITEPNGPAAPPPPGTATVESPPITSSRPSSQPKPTQPREARKRAAPAATADTPAERSSRRTQASRKQR